MSLEDLIMCIIIEKDNRKNANPLIELKDNILDSSKSKRDKKMKIFQGKSN